MKDEKLVRDLIPSILERKGIKYATRKVANEQERFLFLRKKLVEEANELLSAKTPNQILEELVDVYEVFWNLLHFNHETYQDIMRNVPYKRSKRGNFSNFVILTDIQYPYGMTEKEYRVLRLRKKGLTQEEVANRLGLSRRSIQDYEKKARAKENDNKSNN